MEWNSLKGATLKVEWDGDSFMFFILSATSQQLRINNAVNLLNFVLQRLELPKKKDFFSFQKNYKKCIFMTTTLAKSIRLLITIFWRFWAILSGFDNVRFFKFGKTCPGLFTVIVRSRSLKCWEILNSTLMPIHASRHQAHALTLDRSTVILLIPLSIIYKTTLHNQDKHVYFKTNYIHKSLRKEWSTCRYIHHCSWALPRPKPT